MWRLWRLWRPTIVIDVTHVEAVEAVETDYSDGRPTCVFTAMFSALYWAIKLHFIALIFTLFPLFLQ
jgi:hypothetical protein